MKRIIAFALTVVMAMGIFSGCSASKFTLNDIGISDTVTFGKYQGEAIEWEVLSRNFKVEEGKVSVQLLSKYVLDCQPFNEDGESSWADSSLREWLNSDFLKAAFSSSEQKMIAQTQYFNYTGDERYLNDKVYLLSYLWYRFRNDAARCKPTDYAEDEGVITEGNYCSYWCRDIVDSVYATGGKKLSFASTIGPEGNVRAAGNPTEDAYSADGIGVRPVINIEFKLNFSMRDIDRGDIVTFGKHSGDALEWLVVDEGIKGITLIARYGIEDRRMDRNAIEEFEESDLYEWLNEDFIKDYFTKKQIKLMTEFDSDNYVTLLSKEEIKEAFSNKTNLKYEFYCGYVRSYYEDHPELEDAFPSDQKIIDEFWLSTVYDDGKAMAFSLAHLGKKFDVDSEHSVRPVIRIKF